MTLSNHTLVKIGAIGGVITISMGLLARAKIQDNIKSNQFYKDSLKIVRSHAKAVHLLGEPIKDKSIDIDDKKKNVFSDKTAQYEVPLKGPKDRGTLFCKAIKLDNSTEWIIEKIELEVEKFPNKRLIIKNSENYK